MDRAVTEVDSPLGVVERPRAVERGDEARPFVAGVGRDLRIAAHETGRRAGNPAHEPAATRVVELAVPDGGQPQLEVDLPFDVSSDLAVLGHAASRRHEAGAGDRRIGHGGVREVRAVHSRERVSRGGDHEPREERGGERAERPPSARLWWFQHWSSSV